MEKELSVSEVIEMFEEALDEAGEVKVAGLTFMPSRVLKECDPIAYRTGLSDFEDFLLQEGYTLSDDL